jgi:hypothetical protein
MFPLGERYGELSKQSILLSLDGELSPCNVFTIKLNPSGCMKTPRDAAPPLHFAIALVVKLSYNPH